MNYDLGSTIGSLYSGGHVMVRISTDTVLDAYDCHYSLPLGDKLCEKIHLEECYFTKNGNPTEDKITDRFFNS